MAQRVLFDKNILVFTARVHHAQTTSKTRARLNTPQIDARTLSSHKEEMSKVSEMAFSSVF